VAEVSPMQRATSAIGANAIAWAQSYPSRPITLLVPFGAGGPADAIGRIVAEGMREPLGQPVIIENVAGASGTAHHIAACDRRSLRAGVGRACHRFTRPDNADPTPTWTGAR
jgi:tripartite-type tricarboxylate transporter receptor subunit TctC